MLAEDREEEKSVFGFLRVQLSVPPDDGTAAPLRPGHSPGRSTVGFPLGKCPFCCDRQNLQNSNFMDERINVQMTE